MFLNKFVYYDTYDKNDRMYSCALNGALRWPLIALLLFSGITCDVCLKENFVGIRYKCLACRNYDLCAICYNARRQSQQHSTDHPVQAIVTQIDFGKSSIINHQQSMVRYHLLLSILERSNLLKVPLVGFCHYEFSAY